MVAEAPRDVIHVAAGGKVYDCVEVLVLDASSVTHFPPETLPRLSGQARRDGLGMGRIRLVVDAQERPIGTWEGTWWGEGKRRIPAPTLGGLVAFGRLGM